MAVVDTVDEYLKAKDGGEPAGKNAKGGAEAKPAEDPRVDPDAGAHITRITLQIGKQSSYLPSYIREIWPFAVNETSLDGAALEIEDLPGKEFLIKEIEIEE